MKAASTCASNSPVKLTPETAMIFGMLREDFDDVPAFSYSSEISLPSTGLASSLQ